MLVKTEKIAMDEFYIAGIFVRTINNGQSREDMMALWDKFQNEHVYWQLENKISDDIYCVYTDYESDYTGYYTAILGCKIKLPESLPDGFRTVLIPSGEYCVYHLAGKCPANVLNAWDQIWKSDIKRKYTADYDRYTPDTKNFEDSNVKIYLSV